MKYIIKFLILFSVFFIREQYSTNYSVDEAKEALDQ